MITIFRDFCQFSAKTLAFFLKTNVMIIFLQTLAAVLGRKKRQFLCENILKIITSVPGMLIYFAKLLAKIFKNQLKII
jgi:Mn2+/Fe2+ NRAMP family transporter